MPASSEVKFACFMFSAYCTPMQYGNAVLHRNRIRCNKIHNSLFEKRFTAIRGFTLWINVLKTFKTLTVGSGGQVCTRVHGALGNQGVRGKACRMGLVPVNSTLAGYDASAGSWSRARDVLSGEDAVKAAGERYLPRLDSRSEEAYAAYRYRAFGDKDIERIRPRTPCAAWRCF
jgi:hypothetical protein